MGDQLSVTRSSIDGLFVVDLELYSDARGWFKESYNKQKLETSGLPDFQPVQNNFSYNAKSGVARGLHAEPWDKYISLANGSVFAAWVDLRKGPSFGKTFTATLTPEVATFVPRGIANGYLTLEDGVVYTYLVNDHWSPDTKYIAVNMFDPELRINWPISQSEAILSEKDKDNPLLQDVEPMEF